MCGIIGFSGKNNQNYNIDKLKLLLYSNAIERKSLDATGFYFKGIKDNNPIKGIIDAKKFIGNNEIFNKLLPSSIFIGHVRLKSVGQNTLENAHPYKIGNIIGVHNGTITNIESISKKYADYYYHSKTDSYNLFNSLYNYHKPNPLSKIQGGTAVLFTDTTEDDLLYVYRNDGRELYYSKLPEGMYISSEKDSLRLVCEDNEIYQFLQNNFYTIKDGEVLSNFLILPPKNTTTNTVYQGRFTNKWLLCVLEDSVNKLKVGNWYLTDKTTTYASGGAYYSIVDGMLSDNKKIKSSNPIKNVSNNHFDLTQNYLPASYTEVDGRIVKFMYSIFADNGDLLAEVDDFGIVTSRNYQTDKYKIYVPLRDQTITDIIETDIRVCNDKEEEELALFLTTINEELGKEVENIKFTPINDDIINEKISQFNKKLISELDTLKKDLDNNEIEKSKIKIKELENELNNIF